MKTTYLFTDETGLMIEISEYKDGQGALKRKDKLQNRSRKIIIAWCLMAGNNAKPIY